ncbi:hypothetical protein AAE478_002174 [Parahypoxylon ruwenzoriense]
MHPQRAQGSGQGHGPFDSRTEIPPGHLPITPAVQGNAEPDPQSVVISFKIANQASAVDPSSIRVSTLVLPAGTIVISSHRTVNITQGGQYTIHYPQDDELAMSNATEFSVCETKPSAREAAVPYALAENQIYAQLCGEPRSRFGSMQSLLFTQFRSLDMSATLSEPQEIQISSKNPWPAAELNGNLSNGTINPRMPDLPRRESHSAPSHAKEKMLYMTRHNYRALYQFRLPKHYTVTAPDGNTAWSFDDGPGGVGVGGDYTFIPPSHSDYVPFYFAHRPSDNILLRMYIGKPMSFFCNGKQLSQQLEEGVHQIYMMGRNNTLEMCSGTSRYDIRSAIPGSRPSANKLDRGRKLNALNNNAVHYEEPSSSDGEEIILPKKVLGKRKALPTPSESGPKPKKLKKTATKDPPSLKSGSSDTTRVAAIRAAANRAAGRQSGRLSDKNRPRVSSCPDVTTRGTPTTEQTSVQSTGRTTRTSLAAAAAAAATTATTAADKDVQKEDPSSLQPTSTEPREK